MTSDSKATDSTQHASQFRVIHAATSVLVVSVGLTLITTSAGASPAAKVQLCHRTGRDGRHFQSITVDRNAVFAHVCHGDSVGACSTQCAALCDDGNACTVDECNSSTTACATIHQPLACDDNDSCTADACDAEHGCNHEPVCECPAGTTWVDAIAGCGGTVIVPGASEGFAQKIFSAVSAPVVIEAVSSWDSLAPDPSKTSSTGPALVVAPYQGGSGCDFISNYPGNNVAPLSLDTQSTISTRTGSVTVPAGADVYIAGSDCFLPDDVDGAYRVDWRLAP